MKKLISAMLSLAVLLSLCACNIGGSIIPTQPPAECTVTFDLNGGEAGEGFVSSVTVDYGETVPMTVPTKADHIFVGWYAGDVQFTAETPITEDITLKAEWSIDTTYTLTFDTNGLVDVPAAYPTIGELPAIPETPVVAGHVFAGWYFDAELTNRYFFDAPLYEDTTLYAKFYDTASGEYIVISNVDQLKIIKDDPAAKYLLACDINCKGETLAPIDEFTGELEGNGYKIHNFSMNEDAVNVALIRTNRGVVKNLTFSDFTFDVVRNGGGGKFYGIVCGINYGTVENCVIRDSQINFTCENNYESTYWLYIGGIVGVNYGAVADSKNNAIISLSTTHSGYYWYGWTACAVHPNIGGIVGKNETGATISNCTNTGNVDITCITTTAGYTHCWYGGITGYNAGNIEASQSICDVTFSGSGVRTQLWVGGAIGQDTGAVKRCSAKGNITIETDASNDLDYIGGFVGHTSGSLDSCASQGEIKVTNAGAGTNYHIGGFVGYTCGKLYNCYSANNITDNTADIKAIGSFAGFNEKLSGQEFLINKCFSTGSISLQGAPVNVGKFIGLTTGTEKDCYYLDTMTITRTTVVADVETSVPVEPTNDIGVAKSESELLRVDFLENTLFFDRMVWFLVSGKLPELR